MTRRLGNGITTRHALCMALTLSTVALGTNGCALTSKADLVEIRYFSPEHAKRDENGLGASSAAPRSQSPLYVRLGRVASGPSLRERIVYRNTAYELGYYDDFRWTERPENYVRRELGRSLFEVHGIHRVINGAAPTLDIEVIAFDDVRMGLNRVARVQLKAMLYDDDGVLFEDTLTTDSPITGEKPKFETVVAAMANALDTMADRVSVHVSTTLQAKQLAKSTDSTR